MNNIVKRCPVDGSEYDLEVGTCAVCFGTLRFWCRRCQTWLPRAGCALCNESYGAELPPEGDQFSEWILTSLHEIRTIIFQHFTDGSTEAILGPLLYPYIGTSSGQNLTSLALSSDCLRTAVDALSADGIIADDEIRRIHPFLNAVATFYAEYRSHYRAFVNLTAARTHAFVQFYQSDSGPFGYRDTMSSWSGLSICVNLATKCRDTRGLDLYEHLISHLASLLVSLDGTTGSERVFLEAIKSRLSAARGQI